MTTLPRRNRSGAHYRRRRHEARKRAHEDAQPIEVSTHRLAVELVKAGRASPLILGPRPLHPHHRRNLQ